MIHKFTLFDTNIVLDTNSGAVHVFDDCSFDLLTLFEKYVIRLNDPKGLLVDEMIEIAKSKCSSIYSDEEISDSCNEIAELIDQGMLFSSDTYESDDNLFSDQNIVKAMCLHVSHDCNLRCTYCFAGTGDFGGERMLMTEETGKRAIDFLIKNSGTRNNLELDFFGGEPLMNMKVVKAVVEYAKLRASENNKHFNFTMTTNGMNLSEDNIEYINENMGNLVLSMDGRAETNDSMRKTLDGSGSYNKIVPKIIKAADSRNQDNYYIRGTYTANNLDFSNDVLHMADLGFRQISVEPVVATKGTSYEIKVEHLYKLFKEYERLAKEYVRRKDTDEWFNFFHFMLDLSGGPCIAKRLSGCGAGSEYVAVAPNGDIYPCHQFVGINEMKLGNVDDAPDTTLNIGVTEMFKKNNVYSKEECRECFARFYCSGGCAANSYQFNNRVDGVYEVGCELMKKRVECALWIKTQE